MIRSLPIPPALLAITALQGVGAALLIVVVLILTAALGPEAYGRYAWVVAGGGLISILAQHGLPATIVKAFAPLDLTSIKAAPVARTTSLYWTASILALLVAIPWSKAAPGMPMIEAVWMVPIGLGLATVAIADAALRAGDQGLRANVASQLIRPGLIAGIATFLLLQGVDDIDPYLLLYAGAGLVSGIAFLWHFPLMAVRTPRKGVASNPAHFQVAISRSVSNFLPVFIAGFLLPSHKVAYLAIAIQLAAPLQFGLAATRAFYGAKINAEIKQAEWADARELMSKAAGFSACLAALAALGVAGLLYALNQLGIGPFEEFDDAQLLIVMLVLVGLSRAALSAFGPVQMVAIMLDDESSVLRILMALTGGLALGLIIASAMGHVWACAVVMLAYALALSVGLRQRVSIRFAEMSQGVA